MITSQNFTLSSSHRKFQFISRTTPFALCSLLTLAQVLLVNVAEAQDGPVKFKPKLLTVDANEGIALADVDGDGKTDVIADTTRRYRGIDFSDLVTRPTTYRILLGENWREEFLPHFRQIL